MFEEIQDTIEDFTSGKNKNMGTFLLVGIVVILLLVLLKNDDTSEENREVVYTYSSYPDASTNANVIIDTLQNSIDYSEDEIKEYMQENFTATNDYIKEGTESTNKLNELIKDESASNIVFENKVNTALKDLTSKVDNVSKNVNNSIKTSTNSKKSTTNTSVKKSSGTYKKATYKGNSLVDALKSIGVNSSYSYRSQIAKANGIKNYSGSSSQNLSLLKKLKEGTLKKV